MRRAGFTIVELVVLIGVLLVLVAVLGLFFPAYSKRPRPNQQLRDAVQLRGIHSAFVLWAGNNDDRYPLPSAFDVNNHTVSELGRAKDTTANIMSILVSEGFITPELLVSPFDRKYDRIRTYDNYEVEHPTDAVDPEKALWDPKLSADFTSEAGGHISYAHLIPQGSRLAKWGSTYNAEETILSNRGPEMRLVEQKDGEVTTHFATPTTRTTRFFTHSDFKNKDNWWSGNIAYNDNHVEYGQFMYADNKPVGTPYDIPRLKLPQQDGTTLDIHDVIFADEQAPEGKDAWREAYDANQFLGIFTTAGENREDFTSIWD